MAMAIWRTGLGQSPGSDPAQLSGALCAPMVMLGTCWWPSEAAAGGRHLRLARILFKMLRSSKAEISASCGKEENKFSTVSCTHHLQPLIPWASWPISNIPSSSVPLNGSKWEALPTSHSQEHHQFPEISIPSCKVCPRQEWPGEKAQPSHMLCPRTESRPCRDKCRAHSSKGAEIVHQERSQICCGSRWATAQIMGYTIVLTLES